MKLFTIITALIAFSMTVGLAKAQTNAPQEPTAVFQASNGVEMSPNAQFPHSNNLKSYPWTLQFTHSVDTIANGLAGIETDGTYFYIPVWSNDTIYKLDSNGAFVEKFVISGVSGLRDLAYDGTYFYGSASSNVIYKMNFTTKTLVATITAPSGVAARHIAYDPINNGLWCGNWQTDIWLVSATNGAVLDTIPAIGSPIAGTYGSAFDTISAGGPYLWLFDQSGSLVTLYQVNVATEQYTGYNYDISNDISLASGALAGGLFISPGLVGNTFTLGGLVQGDMIFGYDLASTLPNNVDIGVYNYLSPSNGYNKSNNETVSVVVKNYGATTVNSYSVSYTVNGGTAVTQAVSTPIAPFAIDTITFTTGANMSTIGTYSFNFYTTLSSDLDHSNDTISASIEHLSPTNTFPYAESFESGLGGWVQSTNDMLDWTIYTGTTPSSSTGPAAGASDGAYYLYVETSSPVATGDSAIISMPFNFSSLVDPRFKFDYNMTGSGMGSLSINIYDGTTMHYNVWSKSGPQTGDWNTDTLDLNAYKSSSYVEIQFVGTKGSTWSSDMAIDNLSLFDNYVPFNVLLVDDDGYGSDESSTIATAISNSGAVLSTYNIGSGTAPIYDTLSKYDLVIWTTGNDGTNLYLWDVSDTASNGDGAIKYNAALTQYLDSNGTVWIDGLDYLYDVYGPAPRNFTAGDFAYDQMGINKYAAQSKSNDGGTGVSMAIKVAGNTTMTLDTIKWKYSTIWYADGLDLTAAATPLYVMGPSTYPLAGKKIMHYYGNNIISTLRVAKLGNGGSFVQADVDQLVDDVINMVKTGLTPKTGDIVAPVVSSVSATSTTSVIVDFSEAMSATAMDTIHYTGLGSISAIAMNASNTQATLTLANALTIGQSYNLAIEDVEDASGNIMDSAQSFSLAYTVPSIIPNLVITEIMYNGPESGSDTTEFIEIYNNDTAMVDLAGYHFVQGFTYTFPSVNIDTNSYVLIAVDSVKFFNTFGVQAYQWTAGGLSNGGEDIILVNAAGDTVDIVDYDDSGVWPTSPDGNGPSLTLCNPNMDNSNGANWSAATTFVTTNAAGDSIWANPGTDCGTITPPPSGDTIAPVVSNAALNSATSVSVYFSEPVGVSAETTTNYTGLGTVSNAIRNANGDMVTLTLATALVDGAANTLTVANVKDTSGNVMLAPQNFELIFNGSNANLLVTEIMYNDLSSSDSLEYFEIYNNGSSTVNLGGMEVTQGVHYTFPANTMLNADDYLVIAKDSSLVNSVFGISGTHQWTSGGLKNSGEDIAIQNSLGDTMAYVDYDDASPWPVEADGDGPSLEFCDKTLDNNDGNNWSISEKFVTTFNGDSIFGTPGADCYHDAINVSLKNNINVDIYPNPALNKININSNGATYQMSIFDVSGSIVMNIVLNGKTNTIDISTLNSGIYFIQFIDTKTANRITKKLIIK